MRSIPELTLLLVQWINDIVLCNYNRTREQHLSLAESMLKADESLVSDR